MNTTPQKNSVIITGKINSPSSINDVKERLKIAIRNLQNNQTHWQTAHERGLNLCKFIESIKIKSMGSGNHNNSNKNNNNDNTSYPETMLNPCEKLKEIGENFENILLKSIDTQKSISNLIKLCENNLDEKYGRTWGIQHFEKFAKKITELYREDLKKKKFIIENIAHSQNKVELIVYVTLWEQSFVTNDHQKLYFKILTLETADW